MRPRPRFDCEAWRRMGAPMRGRRWDSTVFVVAPQNRGWILEAICFDLAQRVPGRCVVWYEGEGSLPRASRYYFSHPSLYWSNARLVSRRSRAVVLFTHATKPFSSRQVDEIRRRRPILLCMSSEGKRFLLQSGISPGLVHNAIPGVDVRKFASHRRGQGVIGFCSSYYERKNPEVMFDIVRRCPTEPFVLVGRNWETGPWLSTIDSLTNLHYVQATYERYPELYRSMDIFVSPSTLEGGPMPLLEAMLSNVVPVATSTGFAPDLINHGENGYLVPTSGDADDFIRFFPEARKTTVDVRRGVTGYSVEAYAGTVAKLLDVRD